MIARSFLFVPGHNSSLINKALLSYADVLLLDVEDSVPLTYKQQARETIQNLKSKYKDRYIFPRINDRESGELLKDVQALSIPEITGFMYPKSNSEDDIYFIDKLLETIEYEKKLPIGYFKLIPLIETSAAVLNVLNICKASKRVVAIALGSEDLIANMQASNDFNNLFFAKSMVVTAARASGICPIDTVHTNVHDLEELEKHLIFGKNLGFGGKLILNPKEINLVHKYYTPSEEEVRQSLEMLKLYEQSSKDSKGVNVMDGIFVGPPMVEKAKLILKLTEKLQEYEKSSDIGRQRNRNDSVPFDRFEYGL